MNPTPRHWRVAAVAAATAALTLASLSPTTASTSSAAGNLTRAGDAPDPDPAAGAASQALTLITGDILSVTTAADGRQSVSIVHSAGTSERLEVESGPNGDLYAYPDAALAAVGSGIVDAELFNVTRTLAEGHGDEDTSKLPAILEFRGAATAGALKQRSSSLPGSRNEQAMPGLRMASLDVDKADAEQFWGSVKPTSHKSRSGSISAAPGAAGVTKIWYDGVAETTLDESVPQIGAPEAWAQGFDGTGTSVAILDTGVDLGHADVAPRVTLSESFVTGQTVQDGNGHGTHVASTIAGSGAESDGRLKGVAPGADLLVGKVLGDNGKGPLSGILAGMEWAVAQQADVINMSLGAANPPVGGDVLTRAVDRLSAESDSLFVVAAGNEGPGDQTLGTPGTADAALTVGAVDKTGKLADFSSRGPRKGDMVMKPDITAPGVGIVAARAAGTSMGKPVDEHYTAASGTSMATPHVAGAAAIVHQAHPGWDGERIKRALVATARIAPEQTAYQQGSGQAFVPAAVTSTIDLAGRADFALVEWVPGTYPSETRALTFTNDDAETAVLTLSTTFGKTDGTAAPDHVTLSSAALVGDSLTVPAGGTVTVTVTLDPNGLDNGSWYGGHVVATAADGSALNSPIGAAMDLERHPVTLNFTDRNGKVPTAVRYTLHGMDNEVWLSETLSETGSRTYDLPGGSYSVEGTLSTRFPDGNKALAAYDMFAIPNVTVTDAAVSHTVDGTRASDFTVTVKGERRPLERSTYMSIIARDGDGPSADTFRGTANLLSDTSLKTGAIPTDQAQVGGLHLFNFLAQREPLAKLRVNKPSTRNLATLSPLTAPRLDRDLTARLVDAGTGTPSSVKGAIVLMTHTTDDDLRVRVEAAESAGAVAVLTTPSLPGPLAAPAVSLDGRIPVVTTDFATSESLRDSLAKGSVTLDLATSQESDYVYSANFADRGAIPISLAKTVTTGDFARIRTAYHTDGVRHLGQDKLNAWSPGQATSIRTLQLTQLGQVRDEFVLANSDQIFQHAAYQTTSSSSAMVAPERTYPTRGATYAQSWFKASLQQSQYEDGPCNFCRGDWFTRSYLTAADSDPQHQMASGYSRVVATYRNGVLYPDQASLLVPESAEYRFVMDLVRPADAVGIALASTIRNDFRFTSAAPTTMAVPGCEQYVPAPVACESMPVILVSSRMPVDINNQARAGRVFTFEVEGSRAKGWTAGTRMAGATSSVSYDGGRTWQKGAVRRADDASFAVTVRHPKLRETDGFVWVRTEIWDADGNRTVQTVNRAYALR